MVQCTFYKDQVTAKRCEAVGDKSRTGVLEIVRAWRCQHPTHSPTTEFAPVNGCVSCGGRLDRCLLTDELFWDV